MGKKAMKRKHLASVPREVEEVRAPTLEPADGPPLKVSVMTVTPELAKKWLADNHNSQRRVNHAAVQAIADDIRAGAWKLTHQGICFDKEGALIDGQHRLHAIAHAGIPVEIMVTKSQVGSFHDPVDRIRPRTVALIMGVNARDTACFNMLRMLEVGMDLNTPLTVAEATATYERHQLEVEELHKLQGWTKLHGPVGAAVIWAMPCGKEKAMDFARKVITGEMIARGNPAYAFRGWRERKGRGSRGWTITMAALNCLRHYLNDVDLTSVFEGEMGYRGFCSRRRALKIQNTPSSDIVPGVGWKPSKTDRDEAV